MDEWVSRKKAALAYSRLRPRMVVTEVTPVAGQRIVPLPADALGVVSVSYGVEVSLTEALTSAGTDRGWALADGALVLTPAPGDATPVSVIYTAQHTPDEETQTFPTIPANHLAYVDDLALSYRLEAEADAIEQGPIAYTIGQTVVNRAAALAGLRQRALRLRTEVVQQLDEPVAFWR